MRRVGAFLALDHQHRGLRLGRQPIQPVQRARLGKRHPAPFPRPARFVFRKNQRNIILPAIRRDKAHHIADQRPVRLAVGAHPQRQAAYRMRPWRFRCIRRNRTQRHPGRRHHSALRRGALHRLGKRILLRLATQRRHRLKKTQPAILLQELDRIPIRATTEAVIKLLGRIHLE